MMKGFKDLKDYSWIPSIEMTRKILLSYHHKNLTIDFGPATWENTFYRHHLKSVVWF